MSNVGDFYIKMNSRNTSLLEHSTPEEQEQKYEFLKMANKDLVNEVVMLRQAKSQIQSDNEFLMRKNMDADFKIIEYMQILSNIDQRSKVCLNKIVECSNELTQIISLAKSFSNIDNRKSSEDILVSSKSNSNSFKQVVTPHAVNGHIIHTPTIRLARYNEPRPQPNGRTDEEEDPGDNSEDSPDSNDEMNEVDPENETDGHNNESENPEELVAEESEGESMRLPTIQEESPTASMIAEEERPIFSGRCHEVKIYLNQSAVKNSRINNKRGVGGSGDYVPDDSSMSVSTTGTPNNSCETVSQLQTSERLSGPKSESPKPNSFAKRKSLGSPVPQKIPRRSGSLGKPVHSMSSTSPDISDSSGDTLRELATKMSKRGCCLNESSIPSTSSVQCSNIEATQSESRKSATMADNPEISVSVLQNHDSSMNIDKNSIHSTPLSTVRSLSKGSKTSTDSKVTSRRKGNVRKSSRRFTDKELIVKLERSDLQSLEKSIKKSSNSFSEKRRDDENNAEIEVKPPKKIKREIKIERATPPKVVISERPRRAAKPMGSFQEPNCIRSLAGQTDMEH